MLVDAAVEVWVEKEALAGVIQLPAERWRCPWFCCRGYVSQSEQHAAAKRFEHRQETRGQRTVVIHLGDHDPSGIDMTRDIYDRASMFTWAGGYVEVRRIALNMDQVDEQQPPPNPAKLTDSRVGAYLARYGDESWELDALNPRYLDRIIDDEIRSIVDYEAFERVLNREEEAKQRIQKAAKALAA